MEDLGNLNKNEIRQLRDAQQLLRENKLGHLDLTPEQENLINRFNFDRDGNITNEDLNDILKDKDIKKNFYNFKELIKSDPKLKKLLGEDFFGKTKRNIGNSFIIIKENLELHYCFG